MTHPRTLGSYYKNGMKKLRVVLDTHEFYLFFYETTTIAEENLNKFTLSDGVNVIEYTISNNSIKWIRMLEETYPERVIKYELLDYYDGVP